MKIVESILTKNPCYTAGKTIVVKGLMLHSVGCPQPKASVFINSWNPPANGSEICVHGFIDGNDGIIYQTLPWNHRGWHGGGDSNNTHIGVEMCEPACIKYTSGSNFSCSDTATAKAVAKRTYESAVELFAMLCEKYKLDPLADGVVISHAEGYKRGVASNHGDPEHLWRQLGMNYTMDTFRAAVKTNIGGSAPSTPTENTPTTNYPEKLMTGYYRVRKTWADKKSQVGAYRILSNAKAQVDKNSGFSVFDDSGKAIYSATANTSTREYAVVKGDSLWAIAAKLLGSGTRYTEIVKLNGLTSNTIYSGQKLKIPN